MLVKNVVYMQVRVYDNILRDLERLLLKILRIRVFNYWIGRALQDFCKFLQLVGYK